MDLPTLGAGILKVGSLSGLLAFVWQLVKAYDERRGRLVVETLAGGEASLVAIVKYRPKGAHIGLVVRATLLDPSGAQIAGLERSRTKRTLREEIERSMEILQASRTTEIKLRTHPADGPGVYSAEVNVNGLGGDDPAAKVRFEVWTTAYPRRLAAATLSLSATD